MFSNKESVNLFLAEYPTEASGRYPLTIQNCSMDFYDKMIEGIIYQPNN